MVGRCHRVRQAPSAPEIFHAHPSKASRHAIITTGEKRGGGAEKGTQKQECATTGQLHAISRGMPPVYHSDLNQDSLAQHVSGKAASDNQSGETDRQLVSYTPEFELVSLAKCHHSQMTDPSSIRPTAERLNEKPPLHAFLKSPTETWFTATN